MAGYDFTLYKSKGEPEDDMAIDYACIYRLSHSGDYIEISADILTDIGLMLEWIVIDITDHKRIVWPSCLPIFIGYFP